MGTLKMKDKIKRRQGGPRPLKITIFTGSQGERTIVHYLLLFLTLENRVHHVLVKNRPSMDA